MPCTFDPEKRTHTFKTSQRTESPERRVQIYESRSARKRDQEVPKREQGRRPYRRSGGYEGDRYGRERPERERRDQEKPDKEERKVQCSAPQKKSDRAGRWFYSNVRDGRTYSEVGQKHSNEARKGMTTSQDHRSKSRGDGEKKSDPKSSDRNKPEQKGCSSAASKGKESGYDKRLPCTSTRSRDASPSYSDVQKKNSDKLCDYQWTSTSGCVRASTTPKEPDDAERARRNQEVETVLRGLFPMVDKTEVQAVISECERRMDTYDQAALVQASTNRMRVRLNQMIGMSLTHALGTPTATIVRPPSEGPEPPRQGFGRPPLPNLKRAKVVMTAEGKWQYEEPENECIPKKAKVVRSQRPPTQVNVILSRKPEETSTSKDLPKRTLALNESPVPEKVKKIDNADVPVGDPQKKRSKRKTCYMKNCNAPVYHWKRHIVGRHLPHSYGPWTEMSDRRRINSIRSFLRNIQVIVGVDTLKDLLAVIKKNKWYPNAPTKLSSRVAEDEDLMTFFH